MTADPRLTRRDVLGLAGTVAGTGALAGCGAVPGLGSVPVELDGEAVAEVADGPDVSVAEPLGVDVADAHVADSRERAESDLASVPLPLSTDDLPNGAMRRQLAGEVEHARGLLASASEAPGVRERLADLRHAREHTRFVAAAWAATNDELTVADVRDRAATVRDGARAFRAEWTYVGTDPARALVVHDAVESWTAAARRYATLDQADARHTPRTVLGVGERAGEAEHGSAYLADAAHAGDRFLASLPGPDPPSVRSTLTAARGSLTKALAGRLEEVPAEVTDPNELVDVDRDLRGTPAGVALDDLHWQTPAELEPTEELAGDVVARSRGLAYAGAFAALRDRVADGETFAVTSVDELRERRSTVVSTFETALADSDDERLAGRLLARPARWIAHVDRDLRRYGETVEARTLEHEVGNYVALASLARAVPTAVTETVAALDTA